MFFLRAESVVRDEGARRFPAAQLFPGDGTREGLRTESRPNAQDGGGVTAGVAGCSRQQRRQVGIVDLPYPPWIDHSSYEFGIPIDRIG